MRYVAAALLTALAGNKITAENIEKILGSVGIEAEKEKLDMVGFFCVFPFLYLCEIKFSSLIRIFFYFCIIEVSIHYLP